MKFTSDQINKNNTWQIGTGDGTRMYHDIFLNWGVAMVAPGNPGAEGTEEAESFYRSHPKIKNWGAVLKQVKKDEWIIARKGKQIIVGIGKVIEEYSYTDIFSDIDGWDLQHFIQVKWYVPQTKNGTIEFIGKPLSQSTLQGCNNQVVFNAIYKNDFEEALNNFNVDEKQLLRIVNPLEIVNALIDNGIRIQDAENISNTIYRIIKLAQWYINNDPDALESEIISFLVLPMLIALGWSEQKIKMEYSNTDLTLFRKAFTGDYSTSPEIIIEAKKFGDGLAFTQEQIKRYAQVFPDCKKFLVTNGFRYKYFEKQKDKFVLIGYFNLLRLRERNFILNVPLTSVQTILEISNLK